MVASKHVPSWQVRVSVAHQACAPVRIALVDGHQLVVEALEYRVRGAYPDAEIVYGGTSVFAAVRHVLDVGCDCAIVGLNPDEAMSPSEVVQVFARHGIAVVALADKGCPSDMKAAFEAGARGYLDKVTDPANVIRAVSTVLAGGTWVPDDLAQGRVRMGASATFSDQERRALVLYASGLTQHSVARRMGIASSTVKHYLDRVRLKCDVAGIPARTKLELHSLARREGLLS